MKGRNILYIGIDDNNNIKIGMTQQSPRDRQAGADYCIWCYSEACGEMNREQLFECERFLRGVFKANYTQIKTDRFERVDEDWVYWFIRVINFFNKYRDYGFDTPTTMLSLRPDLIEEMLSFEKKVKKYLENPLIELSFCGIL